tara:strand:- start:6849 stop:7874 length:1026 start_codon:yes stop_codon:yes gene_type:complete
MNIIIIGAGWYGLHIYFFLKENYPKYKLLILEEKSEIFNNSSYYNQNRLHLGYHYPRSHMTREMCKNNFIKFIDNYRDVVDCIDNNFYCISKESIIDYTTYLKIFDNIEYDHTIISNNFLENLDGNVINTKERIINSLKAKKYFENKLSKESIKLNYRVDNITRKHNKVIINNNLECDMLIDCTYNKLGLQYNCIYELTISLLYENLNKNNMFDSLTIMDGHFFSLFPIDASKNIYTLTHVKHTPLIISENINDINNYIITPEKVLTVKENIEIDVRKYYKNFSNDFNYNGYFTSFKCKTKSNSDNRECKLFENNNIISVNCGKITGIFEFEEYVKNILDK